MNVIHPQSTPGKARWILFFQAEDGIRDGHVTGVQTCALPIYGLFLDSGQMRACQAPVRFGTTRSGRSEERRVGKECRCRRSLCTYEKERKQRRLRCSEEVSRLEEPGATKMTRCPPQQPAAQVH